MERAALRWNSDKEGWWTESNLVANERNLLTLCLLTSQEQRATSAQTSFNLKLYVTKIFRLVTMTRHYNRHDLTPNRPEPFCWTEPNRSGFFCRLIQFSVRGRGYWAKLFDPKLTRLTRLLSFVSLSSNGWFPLKGFWFNNMLKGLLNAEWKAPLGSLPADPSPNKSDSTSFSLNPSASLPCWHSRFSKIAGKLW